MSKSRKLDTILNICDYNFSENWRKKSRAREIVMERAIYYQISRELTGLSLADIGRPLGKDHATVLHGLKIFNVDIKGLPKVTKRHDCYYKLYNTIKKKCQIKFWNKHNKELTRKELMLHENINLRFENKKLKETIQILVA